MRTIPTTSEFNEVLPSVDACYRFLLDRRVFYEVLDCEACHLPMKRYDDAAVFRCNRSNCQKKGHRVSIRKGTFFYESSLNCLEILRLAHLWLAKASRETAMIMSGHSSNTTTAFYKHFRGLVSAAISEEDQIIGGPGCVVEIDETKLGKRKYHRGHRVDGVWVLVGIERGENGKIFLVPLQDRSAATLSEVITRHVRPESTIHTDMWRGYAGLSEMGFTHLSVNHSIEYKNRETGACTNTAEGLNSGLKRRIGARNRTAEGIDMHLGEYIWRRQNADRLFDAFIDSLRDIHYNIE